VEHGRWSDGAAAAYERALRALARRALSEAELRAALAREGHSAEDIEAASLRLRQVGYLDDGRLAEQVVRSHARRGHAARRAEDELVRRGIERGSIDGALERQRLDAAPAPDLEQRLGELLAAERGPLDPRALRRVYNRLLRAGFEDWQVRAALEPHFLSQPDEEPDETAGAARRGRRIAVHDDDVT